MTVDRIETLLAEFSVRARTFNTGSLCGIHRIGACNETGQLHLIKSGAVEVKHGNKTAAKVDQPSLLFYPRPMPHQFIIDSDHGADFVCANLHFEGGAANPIAAALPAFSCLALSELEDADQILSLLFDEAFGSNCGRQAMVDHLFVVLLIQILRHFMEEGDIKSGMLAGMSHPRLRHALISIHEQPAQDWSLDSLAEQCGMSRSIFARKFREIVGITPGAYLKQWRIGLVQKSLLQGQRLSVILQDVGYSHEAALSRAFKEQTGQSPRAWLQSGVRT